MEIMSSNMHITCDFEVEEEEVNNGRITHKIAQGSCLGYNHNILGVKWGWLGMTFPHLCYLPVVKCRGIPRIKQQ